ncbi:MAG TPA: MFS transporter [Burkholderiales bacterium]|jgi:MFS family permease|nr:MFS transporter [Burkholderiales bacterium]
MITRPILVLFALAFLATLGYGIMIPTLSVHAHSLGASHADIGVIISAFAAAQLLTQVPMGRLSDLIGRVYMVVFGFGLMAVAATLYHFATGSGEFTLLQALAGVGGGCLWPPLMAMLTENVEPSRRGRLMGAFNTVFFLGIAFGPLLGGFIASAFGHDAVFTAWTGVALLGAMLCVLTLRESARDRHARAASARSARNADAPLIRPGMMTTFVAGCVVRARGGVCSSFNNALLPLYAIALFDATPEMIGSIMFIHGVGLAVFNIPGGMMSDRMGRRLPALAGSLVATAGVLWYSAASSYWPLFVAVGLAGAGSAFSSPAVAALTADVCDPKRRGEAFGYFLTSFNLGMVLGALVFGFVAEWVGLWGAVFTWGVTSLVLSLCGLLIRESLAAPAVAIAPQMRS